MVSKSFLRNRKSHTTFFDKLDPWKSTFMYIGYKVSFEISFYHPSYISFKVVVTRIYAQQKFAYLFEPISLKLLQRERVSVLFALLEFRYLQFCGFFVCTSPYIWIGRPLNFFSGFFAVQEGRLLSTSFKNWCSRR